MIGLSVFDVEAGKEIGKLYDFILSSDWKIQALELEGKGLFSRTAKVVAWGDIIAYGEDAVMVRNQQAIRKLEADNIQYTYTQGKNKLKDLPVLTQEGVRLGVISDVYFDQEMGNTLISLEISDGFVTDLMEGRKWLPCTSEMAIGEDAVMVPSISEERLLNATHSVNG